MKSNQKDWIFSTPTNEDIQEAISKGELNSIKSVKILNCVDLSEGTIDSIFGNLKKVETIILGNLSESIEELKISEIPDSLLSLTICKSKNLVTLELNKKMENLEHLDFSGCFNLTLSEKIFAMVPKLQSLCIRNVLTLTDEDIKDFCRHWNELEYLDVSESKNSHGLTNLGVSFILNSCKSLNTLKMNNLSHITDVAFTKINELRELEHLEISNCQKLKLKTLEFLQDLENLNFLNIGSNKNIFLDEQTAVDLLNSKFTNLKGLGIAFITLKEANYVSISTELEILDLSWTKINDFGLKKIGKNNKNLKELNITKCSKISDWGIKDLVKFWNKNSNSNNGLSKLVVKSGTDISLKKGIANLLENWKECKIIKSEEEPFMNPIKRRKRKKDINAEKIKKEKKSPIKIEKKKEERLKLDEIDLQFSETEKELFKKYKFSDLKKTIYAEIRKLTDSSLFKTIPNDYLVWCVNLKKNREKSLKLYQNLCEDGIKKFNFGRITPEKVHFKLLLFSGMFVDPTLRSKIGAPIIWVKEGGEIIDNPEKLNDEDHIYTDEERKEKQFESFLLLFERIFQKFPQATDTGLLSVSDFAKFSPNYDYEEKRKKGGIVNSIPYEVYTYVQYSIPKEVKQFMELHSKAFKAKVYDNFDAFFLNAGRWLQKPDIEHIPDIIGGKKKIDLVDCYSFLFDKKEEIELLKEAYLDWTSSK